VNFGQYLQVNRLAARKSGMDVIDEWWPSSRFFLMVLAIPGA
jgi:hypothetical protein